MSENSFSADSKASEVAQRLRAHPALQVAADLLMEQSPTGELPSNLRLHHLLQALPPEQRVEVFAELPEEFLAVALYDWRGIWARDSQLLPTGEDWEVWLILAGRGYGKTRTGAETMRDLVESGRYRRLAFIAPTSADARDTMVEGESGILAVCPPWNRPRYYPSKRRVVWPNGAQATLFSAEEPERTRGPQHDAMWGDEPASWPSKEVWDNAAMGLRLGKRPIAIVTGTPKPVPMVLDMMKDPKTRVTKGNTFENSGNLAPAFIDQVRRIYSGTRIGRQELFAEVLEDMPGALFSQLLIDLTRVPDAPQLERVVISVDPPLTSESGSDECGIMAVGRGPAPLDVPEKARARLEGPHAYVLKDHSVRGTPNEWARAAVKAYYEHKADALVAEINAGGEMVETVVRGIDPNINFRPVRAMRGKAKRAEPCAALYEQLKVHHVGPSDNFAKLEKQQRVFTGMNGRRDDRTDATCWALHDLVVESVFVGLV